MELDRKILVTGATGNVGRLVVDELLALGARHVRAMTNHPARAALPAGVEVVPGYLGHPDSLATAFNDMDSVYLAPLPATVEVALALMRRAGVERVVDLSSTSAESEAAGDPASWYFYAVERAVEASGLAWTHLRPGEFMTNTLIWTDQIQATGVVRDGFGQTPTVTIALEDVAAVAARILLEPAAHVGRTYILSGPTAVRRADMARSIGEAIGRNVRFEDLSPADALAALRPTMGDYAVEYLAAMAHLAEHPPTPSRATREITGRPGTTFAQWALLHADAFAATRAAG